jgi:leucyl aminopeptidase (aminopeptidase T)
LEDVVYDPALVDGAVNAVFTCLAVQPGDRCVLITDHATRTVGAALADQFMSATDAFEAFLLEDYASRPLKGFPAPLAAALEEADVSCYAATAAPRELRARIMMTDIVNRCRIRHAHMVTISERVMREGMRADFPQVDALSRWLRERAREAREIRVTSPAGTDLVATFSPSIQWLVTSGMISADVWGNLPGGEVFTCPERVDGTYVCDGVLGDWLGAEVGILRETPLAVTVENSRIVEVTCRRSEVRDAFLDYISHDPNGDRLGEFAFGTNLAVRDVIGEILQDEKMIGVHIAFGHPYGEHTGAAWTAGTHIDLVGCGSSAWLDGEGVMEEGRYLVDIETFAIPAGH